jgi:hypothetical protein
MIYWSILKELTIIFKGLKLRQMVENLSSKIGFSAMKITPEQDFTKIPLGGYYVRYATGVHDDIYVRTMYMAANEEILIIACDLLALFGKFIKRMKMEIHRITGIKDTNILICALHDHSAPDTLGLEGFRGLVKYTLRGDWFPRIERMIVQSKQISGAI